MRYHARGIVGDRADRGHSYAVHEATQRAYELANALHLVPLWSTAHDAVGVQLHLHRLGIEIT